MSLDYNLTPGDVAGIQPNLWRHRSQCYVILAYLLQVGIKLKMKILFLLCLNISHEAVKALTEKRKNTTKDSLFMYLT